MVCAMHNNSTHARVHKREKKPPLDTTHARAQFATRTCQTKSQKERKPNGILMMLTIDFPNYPPSLFHTFIFHFAASAADATAVSFQSCLKFSLARTF